MNPGARGAAVAVAKGGALKSSRGRRGGRLQPPPSAAHAGPAGFPDVRIIGESGPSAVFQVDGAVRAATAAGKPFNILALSGGGAGGAFGAGALVGLTRAGARPQFAIVTGVSTGALIAPYAFLGPDWDDRLAEAYTGGFASNLFALTALRPGASLYASEPLTELVTRFVDEALVDAVAGAHAEGRRLYVATANLDEQNTVIWDMGAIASRGGAEARKLFTDVLIASSSLPGLFPPKMIEVECEGGVFEEMHVDGGTISPMFIVPEALIVQKLGAGAPADCEVYALVNTTLHPSAHATPMSAVPILVRSFELMLRSSYRSALRSVAAFCEINGFEFRSACVPANGHIVSMLRFDRSLMSEMFETGAELAQSGRLWSKVE
jgi:hypothetical protein